MQSTSVELIPLQVPEDIISVLNDSEVFNNMPEVTTKEILKRYGEIAKNVRPELNSPRTYDTSSINSNSRAGAPVVTRVDTDPNQMHAWQKETSVRHIQQNGAPSYPTTNQHTPPQMQSEFANRNSPYHQRAGSSDSAGAPNRHSRPGGWGKPHNGHGPMGVAN